ncbi:MAG TPA: hypothetical protein VL068_11300 [Microthrixaceae bacterium]|nr:hypothetical protein [Microthrixaceae bacterium]
MILAEAITFDPGVIIAIFVVLAVLAIAACVWTIMLIRFGYRFGRATDDRQRLALWVLFSGPLVLIPLNRVLTGDMRDFGWFLTALVPVVVPPIVGLAVQYASPEEFPETRPENDGT